MPYIRPTRRVELKQDPRPFDPGELNYLLTQTVWRYIDDRGLSYKVLNDAIGALECAKLELYRRMAVPYEDIKIQEHGDVYVSATPNAYDKL